MKNKILTVSALIVAISFAISAYAVGQNDNAGVANQNQQQTQTINQGEDSQIQTQNNEQAQKTDVVDEGEITIENQNQQQSQDGDETEDQPGNNAQEKKQNQNQNKTGTATAEERRSLVANAVQEMLQVADRSGGIGQEIKTIAQTQTQNQEKLEAGLEKIKIRNGLIKLLVGPDYTEIDSAKKILEQNREQIKQLQEVKNKLVNQGDQQTLMQQIQNLEQINLEAENTLNSSQNGFSLFGWMFKLFAK